MHNSFARGPVTQSLGQSPDCTNSFARVFFDDAFARLTLDEAAPLELAVASLGQLLLVSVVAATTAQQIAPIYGRGRPCAAPALRAERSGGRVEGAVVRGGLEIDEVFLCGSVESPVSLDEGGALLVETNLGGTVVSLLQADARVAEIRQLVPTGLETARPGHPVTLTRHTGVLKHGLQTPTDFDMESSLNKRIISHTNQPFIF